MQTYDYKFKPIVKLNANETFKNPTSKKLKEDETIRTPTTVNINKKNETIFKFFESDPCDPATTSQYLQRSFYKSGKNLLNDEVCRRRGRDVAIFMHEMWLRQSMCDVKFICCDGCLMAHQAVLGTYSKMLSKIFAQNSVQLIASINLKETSRKITAEVLNFLYTTDLRLNCRILEEVICCAKSLDLPIILDVCNDYLIQSADPNNILLHYSTAYNSSLDDTKDRLLSVIAQSFDEILSHPHYQLLTKEKLLEILHHPELVADDDEIFVGVLKWVEYLKDERLSYAHELLESIDMKEIELKTMVRLLDEYDWIMIDPDCNQLVMNFYKHHALLKARNKSDVKASIPVPKDNLDVLKTDNKTKSISSEQYLTSILNDLYSTGKKDTVDNTTNKVDSVDKISKFEPKLYSTPIITIKKGSKASENIFSSMSSQGSEVRSDPSLNKFQQETLCNTEKQELSTPKEFKSKFECEDNNVQPYFK